MRKKAPIDTQVCVCSAVFVG